MRGNNGTVLSRLGNKGKLLPELFAMFPPKIVTFIDLFAGSLAVSLGIEKRDSLRSEAIRKNLHLFKDNPYVRKWLPKPSDLIRWIGA